MATNRIQNVIQAIGIASQETRMMVQRSPELLSGSTQDLLDRLSSRIFNEYYQDSDADRGWGEFFLNSWKTRAYREAVLAAAGEPVIGLTDSGPHLLFAEVWVALAVSESAREGGHLSAEGLGETAFLCCQHLLKWSQAGYRMDWHLRDGDKQSPDPSAPLGQWTVEWAKSRTSSGAAASSSPEKTPESVSQRGTQRAGAKKFWQVWK